MADDGPWQRIRRSRIAGVLAVYAGAAWVVLQLIDVLDGIVPLPEWVGPGALILLAIGLVVVLATAFVQGSPETQSKAEAEEVPGAWELDLDRIDDEIRAGGIPHLTWARAALGGVVVFSLLFGAAGLVAFLKYRNAVPAAVPELVAGEVPEPGLAVLPFDLRVTDEELEVWDEGLVVTVAANLDGVEGVRTIDYGTVLARWAERVPEGQVPDLQTALGAARAAGAEWAVRGSLLEIGDDVRIDATVRSVSSGETLDQIRVEGSAEDLVSLIDRLSVEILQVILPEHGLEGSIGLGSVASGSPEAVKAWVEGERDYRLGRFAEADEAFQRAVDVDSMFALAWFRLAQSRGWRGTSPDVLSDEDAWVHVASLADRLSPREQLIVRAQRSLSGADSIAADSLLAFASRHPDDSEAWYILGERYFHLQTAETWERADPAFERAIALQPRFVPYHIHAIDLAFQLHADSTVARERVERLERVAPESPQARLGRVAYDLSYGSPQEREGAAAKLDGLALSEAFYLMGRLSHPAHSRAQEHVAYNILQRPGVSELDREQFKLGGVFSLSLMGRQNEGLELAATVGDHLRRLCVAAQVTVMTGVLDSGQYDRVADPGVLRAALSGSSSPDDATGLVNAASCGRHLAEVAGRSADVGAWLAIRDSALAMLPTERRGAVESEQAFGDSVSAVALDLWAGQGNRAWDRLQGNPFLGYETSMWRVFRGHVLGASGRPEQVLGVLEALPRNVIASLHRARALEALGRDAEAREQYQFFLEYWRPDMPELSALTDSATAGLTRIQTRLN
ncbi:MAG: hypothetical protein P8125_03920 [Gemmatimonadota bacterium]